MARLRIREHNPERQTARNVVTRGQPATLEC